MLPVYYKSQVCNIKIIILIINNDNLIALNWKVEICNLFQENPITFFSYFTSFHFNGGSFYKDAEVLYK